MLLKREKNLLMRSIPFLLTNQMAIPFHKLPWFWFENSHTLVTLVLVSCFHVILKFQFVFENGITTFMFFFGGWRRICRGCWGLFMAPSCLNLVCVSFGTKFTFEHSLRSRSFKDRIENVKAALFIWREWSPGFFFFKGQLISKRPSGVFRSTNKPTKFLQGSCQLPLKRGCIKNK